MQLRTAPPTIKGNGVDIDQHRGKLRRLAFRMLRNEHEADDVVQDVFLKLLTGNFDGRSSTYTWLYRVTYRTCIDRIRARRRRPHVLEQRVDKPDDLYAEREDILALRKAVKQLPTSMRLVVEYRLSGSSHDQIARKMRMNPATVRSQFYKAKVLLSELL